MTTERTDTPDGVQYADPDVHRVAVKWLEERGFDLQVLDNWIERQCAPENRADWLFKREMAIKAELSGNTLAVSFAVLYFLAAIRLDSYAAVLPRPAEKGLRFTPEGRAEGPVKALVRRVLPALEQKLARKATALEVWSACAGVRKSGIKFVEHPTWRRPVKAVPKNGQPVQWERFRVILSEVRKD